MAKLSNQVITIECRVKMSMWDALKLRVAGYGALSDLKDKKIK